jgi:hypothetical protein
LFLDLNGIVQFICETAYFIGLRGLLLFLPPLQLLPLAFSQCQFLRELSLLLAECELRPLPEGSSLTLLELVRHHAFQKSAPRLELLERLQPRVEASRLGRVDEPRDEVSNDLVTLGLELRVQVVLSAVVHLYLSVQRGDVRLVAQLPALKFGYVLRVHITARLEVSGFPVGESLIRYQPIHTFDRSE